MAQETQEKQAFRASIKEPEYVIVLPEIITSGVDRLEELGRELLTDRRYLVEEIYYAMEYERRSSK